MSWGADEGMFTMSLKAAVDMSDAQRKLIRINSGVGGEVVICSVSAEKCLGVLLNKPNSGEHASVAYGGIVRFKAGGTIKGGDEIITNATGYGIASTTSGSTGQAVADVASGGIGSMLKYLGNHAAQA